ncbi:MAG: bifunctional diaminohydroxyphosphoribosylaminopyrimidine deaminase/5-amino-6-(5-phosphoribosylamino)uracil reductase RibD [Deltaproteobacteria bacterium]
MSLTRDSDLSFLSQAFDEARKGRGFCAPNPSVGAVVVKNGTVLSKGYHSQCGGPHAEVEALKSLTEEQAKGSTVYVSLEPCCHHGKTPPCTHLLTQKKVGRVVYGYKDPNPLVSGKGEKFLLENGIACDFISSAEGDNYYEAYRFWTETKLPWVTAKLALSLDGKIAGKMGSRLLLTSSVANAFTHLCRKETDAILTTAKTVKLDNPQLNVRLETETFSKPIYIIDKNLELTEDLKVFSTASHVTLFCNETLSTKDAKKFHPTKVTVVPVKTDNGLLELNEVFNFIGQQGVHELWVEAGGFLFEKLHQEKWVKRTLIYTCPVWVGEEGTPAFRSSRVPFLSEAHTTRWQSLGQDGLLEIRWQQ